MGTPQSDILNPRHPPNKRQIVSLNNQQWPNQSLERLSTSVLPPLVVLAITCTTLVETQRSLRSKSRLICLMLLQRSSRRSQDVPRKLRRRARSGQMRLAQSLPRPRANSINTAKTLVPRLMQQTERLRTRQQRPRAVSLLGSVEVNISEGGHDDMKGMIDDMMVD